MYERLINKKEIPTIDEFLAYIGKRKGLFEKVNDFLINELNAGNTIKFDAHSSCWKMSYYIKRYYICDIISENDAFTIVTRLSEESIKSVYEDLMLYAKECIDKSPYRHRGWIEYRVLSEEHIEDSKKILQTRANC